MPSITLPPITVRPFRRSDREQLTDLVNAHTQAVVPGLTVSVNTVLSQLERQPGEFIVDPWVRDRVTLVAEQGRIVAAAHLLRYYADDRAGPAYRGLGEIHWFLFWPEAPVGNPHWPSSHAAAHELMVACTQQLTAWGVATQCASGDLPAPGVYGVPDQWPHVAAMYRDFGFVPSGHREAVYLARVDRLPTSPAEPLEGLCVRRSVGMNGTRMSAVLGELAVGYIEVEILREGERLPRWGGWADVGNLRVDAEHRRRGMATWLLGHAADWLRLANVERLLDYAWLDGTDPPGRDDSAYRAFLTASGFVELTRTTCGWSRSSFPTPSSVPKIPPPG
jgi:GNAT superfamily N-acetyltransferase